MTKELQLKGTYFECQQYLLQRELTVCYTLITAGEQIDILQF